MLTTPPVTAADRVIANLGPKIGPAMPREFLDTPLASGTLASEFDRAVRVRVERAAGGEPSLTPETTAARTLLESPAGGRFERLMLATVNTAALHAGKGADNLHSITLAPDEHATVAAEVMSKYIDHVAAGGKMTDATETPTELAEDAARIVATEQASLLPMLAFSAGWNGNGNVTITPDQSRMLLSTIGAYTPRPGDAFLHAKAKPDDRTPTIERSMVDPYERKWRTLDAIDTLVHERHHSVSPPGDKPSSEATNIFEEISSILLASRERGHFAQRSGLDLETPTWTPELVKDESNLGWSTWNRDQLPPPDSERVATGQARYTDGPQVARDLLAAANIDRRTRDGHLIMTQIMQGGDIALAPRRFADIMIDRLGIAPEHREELVTRIRDSVQHADGSRHVTKWLEGLGVQLDS